MVFGFILMASMRSSPITKLKSSWKCQWTGSSLLYYWNALFGKYCCYFVYLFYNDERKMWQLLCCFGDGLFWEKKYSVFCIYIAEISNYKGYAVKNWGWGIFKNYFAFAIWNLFESVFSLFFCFTIYIGWTLFSPSYILT